MDNINIVSFSFHKKLNKFPTPLAKNLSKQVQETHRQYQIIKEEDKKEKQKIIKEYLLQNGSI
jgi:hypothetical protein